MCRKIQRLYIGNDEHSDEKQLAKMSEILKEPFPLVRSNHEPADAPKTSMAVAGRGELQWHID